MKKISGIYSGSDVHWVGNGFPVKTLFTYNNHGADLSPFLLMDLAGPHQFSSAAEPRGVGKHPHRGFQTVTIVFEGEVSHADSTGEGGTIGPGDVQWMTAGKGILHEEFHSESFTKSGGIIQVAQLWVNLPAQYKMTRPSYQPIKRDQIPVVQFPKKQGHLRVIAGDYHGVKGPAQTFTPINLWDVYLAAHSEINLELPNNWSTGLVVVDGDVNINEDKTAASTQTIVFERKGQTLRVSSINGAHFLILAGEPIDEPVVGSGPFVMNQKDEIKQALDDFKNNRF
ncbi:Pirin [Methylophaga frappieri]|uniref:Pirin n=1 Tax=Methylophaga frappieri (strain ATCC BAA-2434 / DSM 25690 / JAM7) TaxID=754477 RepID=I1YES5_METFJ|nr:pirin family protein [Methylophaga frappieri]AFJ01418.1 Pirin [Methylophaga frappieri]